MPFSPPVADLTASLYDTAGFGELGDAFPDIDRDTVVAILESAGQLAAEVLAPLNRPGDLKGATLENGAVRAAPGFAEAYRAFAQGGWNSLSAEPDHGGQGLPKALEIAVFEMIQAANLAFGLCPMLTQGAIEAVAQHGSDRQKSIYLTRLISGEWTGTMNLTEPHAGSDLAALTTRAEDAGDGTYRLFGQKIFITWGDHDAADNIVHLVLGRLPDAPAGVRGLTLFLCPKVLVDDQGALGEHNALRTGGVEHKLGIHASPTCTMLFEGAKAEIVGEPNQGIMAMFTMMNSARLHVGAQGVAIAERAYQRALNFSRERRQGRSAWTGEFPAPLFDLPDVRRTLMLMKAKVQAARGICLSTAVAADLARTAKDPQAAARARRREELLTPLAKGWSTDMGVEVASLGLQIHGGMGFVEETGAAQYYRDARILPIYEGTNGIQAMDLIGRKLSMEGGQAVRDLFEDIAASADALTASDERLQKVGAQLTIALAAAREATAWLEERRGASQPDVLAGATAYLKLMGDLTGGWMLAKAAAAAPADEGRAALARFYADQVLAGAQGLAVAVMQGAAELERFDA